MADLTHEQKVRVVIGLAQFMTPTEVVEVVKEEFEIDITRQQVRHYNPEQSSEVAEEWKNLWKKERAKFIKSRSDSAIAHSNFRLRELTTMYRDARRKGSTKMAAALLEQAAKEEGGQFTNKTKQELTGKNGGPVQHKIQPSDVDYRNAAAPLAPKPKS